MEFRLKYGDTVVGVGGTDYLVSGIKEELADMLSSDSPSDVEIDIFSSREVRVDESYVGFNPYPRARMYPTYTLYIPKNGEGKIVVLAEERKFHFERKNALDFFADLVWRLYDRTNMSLLDTFTYTVINGVIEPVALFLLPEMCPIMHASGLSYRGSGAIISGLGGVGKTTTMLRLLLKESEMKYLTDDKAIVDFSGKLIYYPRKMMVYEYNLQDIPELGERLKSTQNLWDRVHWWLHSSRDRNRMRRRRLRPEDVFGPGRVERDGAPLRLVFLLQKDDVGSIRFEEMDYGEYGEIMGGIMRDDEFGEFSRFLFTKAGTDSTEWMEKYVRGIVERFARARTRVLRVRVPKNVNYRKLESMILQEIKSV